MLAPALLLWYSEHRRIKSPQKKINYGYRYCFYPAHPSPEKTHFIETTPLPVLSLEKPIPVSDLCGEFRADAHQKPSIELSDSPDGATCALVIFPTDDHYSKVSPGDTVVVRANYLVMCNRYGLVMKHSELLNVK